MEPGRNQEYDERQMRYKLSECYRWLWVGMIFVLVMLTTVMDACWSY